MDRPNLTVETLALVTKVLFEGKRAVGVEYTARAAGAAQRRRRRGRSCAAARSTPRSCCSCPASATRTSCEPLGVDVVHDLPGVGENLQDHLEVYIQYASKQPVSIAPGLRWRNRPRIGFEWLFLRRGLGATNHFEGGGFVRSNDDVDYPNLMFHFLPIAIRYDGSRARPRATATRCTSARCTPTPAAA